MRIRGLGALREMGVDFGRVAVLVGGRMEVFKRIEVWVLLALTAAGLVFVMLTRQEQGADAAGGGAGAERPAAAVAAGRDDRRGAGSGGGNGGGASGFETGGVIEVSQVSLERDGDALLAGVAFEFDNRDGRPVHTIDEAKLVTASGRAVPVFFLAFTGVPPVLPADAKSPARLRFALDPGDVGAGTLALDIRGARALVKSAGAFDPAVLAGRGEVTFDSPDWN